MSHYLISRLGAHCAALGGLLYWLGFNPPPVKKALAKHRGKGLGESDSHLHCGPLCCSLKPDQIDNEGKMAPPYTLSSLDRGSPPPTPLTPSGRLHRKARAISASGAQLSCVLPLAHGWIQNSYS